MSGVELINQLNDLSVKLRESVSYMRRAGENYARAQNAYKIAVNQEFLRLRADGTPVTMISKIVTGQPEVAPKMLERDIAETLYKTAQENIQAIKLQMRILENQIDREYRG
jgi:hypothetical protein